MASARRHYVQTLGVIGLRELLLSEETEASLLVQAPKRLESALARRQCLWNSSFDLGGSFQSLVRWIHAADFRVCTSRT